MAELAPTSPPGRSRGRWATQVVTLVALAAGAFAFFEVRAATARLDCSLESIDGRVASMERTLQLMRMEQQSAAGAGLPALLERLRHWGPQMAMATTPAAELPRIEENLQAILAGFGALGPPAFDDVLAEVRACERGRDDEIQKWLLLALLEIDQRRGTDVLAAFLEGLEFVVSPRMRLFAADQLTEFDRPRAALALRKILQTESYRGLDLQRVAPAVLAEYPDAAQRVVQYSGFWNFVHKYGNTQDAETAQTLMMLLGRRHEHDLLTLQECVKELGALGNADATDRIEDLFENPPRGFSPMFRNHCLDALARIQGAAACAYFREAQRREEHPLIQTKLTELIKKHCG